MSRALCNRLLIHTWAGMRLERLDWEQGWLVRGLALLVRANCHELGRNNTEEVLPRVVVGDYFTHVADLIMLQGG